VSGTFFDEHNSCLPAVLKKLGINKRDRVVIYLPMIPEAAEAHPSLRQN
jgi:acyl-coenzyme A synthetase/AMP-(fatty) acid ligase